MLAPRSKRLSLVPVYEWLKEETRNSPQFAQGGKSQFFVAYTGPICHVKVYSWFRTLYSPGTEWPFIASPTKYSVLLGLHLYISCHLLRRFGTHGHTVFLWKLIDLDQFRTLFVVTVSFVYSGSEVIGRNLNSDFSKVCRCFCSSSWEGVSIHP